MEEIDDDLLVLNKIKNLDVSYEEKLSSLTETLATHSHPYDIWLEIAKLHFENENFTSAKSALETCLGIEPCNVEALSLRGCVLENLNSIDEATFCWLSILNQEPFNAVALEALGRIYYEKKQFDGALSSLARLEEMRALTENLVLMRSKCLRALHKFSEALSVIDNHEKIHFESEHSVLEKLEIFKGLRDVEKHDTLKAYIKERFPEMMELVIDEHTEI